jgi:hypothetical protein
VEERSPVLRVAANILNKQSRTAETGWSSSLEVGRGANNSSPSKRHVTNEYKPANRSLGLQELKQHKPWFDEECLGFLN